MRKNSFEDDFRSALVGGSSYAELVNIVQRYKSQGLTQRETYQILEIIREKFRRDEDEDPLCERIEDVMDAVWGFCGPTKALWSTSLSEESHR